MRFPYAGVQSSSSCYCGLHYGKYGQLEHEECNTPCEADASEMCGGLFKNSLFHTGNNLLLFCILQFLRKVLNIVLFDFSLCLYFSHTMD